MRGRAPTHGMTKTKIYSIWCHMRERCRNVKSGNYFRKGITVDDSWIDFMTFYNEFGHDYKPGLSIDRIDTYKGYSKENCRWATPKEQARNRTDNVLYEYQNRKITLAEIAEINKVPYARLFQRVKDGWPLEDAIHTKPLSKSECGKVSSVSPNHVNNKKHFKRVDYKNNK